MSLVRAAWYHLRALVRRSRVDEELDLELRDHIARETKANVARGMSEKEARRAALVAFGVSLLAVATITKYAHF